VNSEVFGDALSVDRLSPSYFIRRPRALLVYALGMLKPKRANRVVACLVCWTCHGRMGPNHFTAVCGLCQTKNPLDNLRKMSIQEVTEPSEILVCFTQGGTAATHPPDRSRALDYRAAMMNLTTVFTERPIRRRCRSSLQSGRLPYPLHDQTAAYSQ
jgi:hypothetical protein